MFNAQAYCAEIDRTGSRGQAAGRRDLNCQQTLVFLSAVGALFLGAGLLSMLTNPGWGRTLFQKEESATAPQLT